VEDAHATYRVVAHPAGQQPAGHDPAGPDRRRRRAFTVVAVTLMAAATVGAVAVAWNQRTVAAQWRGRQQTAAGRADRAAADLAAAQHQVTDLEGRLAGLAHDNAARGDAAAVGTVLHSSVQQALQELLACSAGSLDGTCLQGIRDATSILGAVSGTSP